MKANNLIRYFLLLTVLASGVLPAVAQDKSTPVSIETIPFTYNIVKDWIEVYNSIFPEAPVALAESNHNATIKVTLQTPGEEGKITIPVARYALLPVANSNNPLLNELKNKALDRKKITALFFEEEATDEEKYPFKSEATIYSGARSYANAALIAGHFKKNTEQLRGKRIAGDDIYLTQAVGKDVQGVTFNYLNYLYDAQTRQLKENISLLPLNIKKEQWKALATGLDETLELLEEEKVSLIPVENLNLSFDPDAPADVHHFIRFVITQGQEVTHKHGFLQLGEKNRLSLAGRVNY